MKSRSDRHGGKRQWNASLGSCAVQSRTKVVMLMALGAIAHAELDCEVNAEAHEQCKKGNRDQIEGADQKQTRRRRHCKARGDSHHHRQDNSDGT